MLENHPVCRSGSHPSFVRRGAFYAAVFNGSDSFVGIVPTVCTVGYKYIVGFAD